MLTDPKTPSFLRRLLLPAAVVGALAFGLVAGESKASAQEYGVEVVPRSPGYGYGYGYGYAPGYRGHRPGYGRTWYGGGWSHPGHAWGGGHRGGEGGRGGWGGRGGAAGHGGGAHGGGAHGGGGHGGGGHGHR